jgi:hypothetical protein
MKAPDINNRLLQITLIPLGTKQLKAITASARIQN